MDESVLSMGFKSIKNFLVWTSLLLPLLTHADLPPELDPLNNLISPDPNISQKASQKLRQLTDTEIRQNLEYFLSTISMTNDFTGGKLHFDRDQTYLTRILLNVLKQPGLPLTIAELIKTAKKPVNTPNKICAFAILRSLKKAEALRIENEMENQLSALHKTETLYDERNRAQLLEQQIITLTIAKLAQFEGYLAPDDWALFTLRKIIMEESNSDIIEIAIEGLLNTWHPKVPEHLLAGYSGYMRHSLSSKNIYAILFQKIFSLNFFKKTNGSDYQNPVVTSFLLESIFKNKKLIPLLQDIVTIKDLNGEGLTGRQVQVLDPIKETIMSQQAAPFLWQAVLYTLVDNPEQSSYKNAQNLLKLQKFLWDQDPKIRPVLVENPLAQYLFITSVATLSPTQRVEMEIENERLLDYFFFSLSKDNDPKRQVETLLGLLKLTRGSTSVNSSNDFISNYRFTVKGTEFQEKRLNQIKEVLPSAMEKLKQNPKDFMDFIKKSDFGVFLTVLHDSKTLDDFMQAVLSISHPEINTLFNFLVWIDYAQSQSPELAPMYEPSKEKLEKKLMLLLKKPEQEEVFLAYLAFSEETSLLQFSADLIESYVHILIGLIKKTNSKTLRKALALKMLKFISFSDCGEVLYQLIWTQYIKTISGQSPCLLSQKTQDFFLPLKTIESSKLADLIKNWTELSSHPEAKPDLSKLLPEERKTLEDFIESSLQSSD